MTLPANTPVILQLFWTVKTSCEVDSCYMRKAEPSCVCGKLPKISRERNHPRVNDELSFVSEKIIGAPMTTFNFRTGKGFWNGQQCTFLCSGFGFKSFKSFYKIEKLSCRNAFFLFLKKIHFY